MNIIPSVGAFRQRLVANESFKYLQKARKCQIIIIRFGANFFSNNENNNSFQSTLTHHIIPREISQKICDKISAGEDFKCYILVS
jgi:hypothetical protein